MGDKRIPVFSKALEYSKTYTLSIIFSAILLLVGTVTYIFGPSIVTQAGETLDSVANSYNSTQLSASQFRNLSTDGYAFACVGNVSSGLNVRQSPNASGALVASLPAGRHVLVRAGDHGDVSDNFYPWKSVEFVQNGRSMSGFVTQRYLTTQKTSPPWRCE